MDPLFFPFPFFMYEYVTTTVAAVFHLGLGCGVVWCVVFSFSRTPLTLRQRFDSKLFLVKTGPYVRPTLVLLQPI